MTKTENFLKAKSQMHCNGVMKLTHRLGRERSNLEKKNLQTGVHFFLQIPDLNYH